MSFSKHDNSNLFNVLQRGDRCIKEAYKTAIMMVGLTRAGKSTTFNWVLGKPIIGVGEQSDTHYENLINDTDSAEVGDTFTSVTLCPNIKALDTQNEISLIDMAGYKDKRDYIGVLGVSYFLKAVFEKVDKVKFLIVMDEHKLIEKGGDGVIATFLGFLNMFNLNLFTPQLRIALYDSISLVITHSQKQRLHQKCLRKIYTQIKDQKLIVQKKEEILLLLDDIINKNRLEAFPVAVANQNPPKCDFIHRFNSMGWKSFDFRAAESQLNNNNPQEQKKAELVALPFKRDYSELKDDQKKLFNDCIKKRVDSYIDFSNIVNTLIQSIRNKWETAITEFQITRKLKLNLGRCPSLFQKIEVFLDANDFYNSKDLVPVPIKPEYSTLNFVRSIKQILKICDFIDKINKLQYDRFMENMEKYPILFGQLIEYLKAFAGEQSQEHLLQRLAFIIKRGFREFSKLYQINPEVIHDADQKMRDNCNYNILDEETKKEFIERFIKKINQPLIQALFRRVQDIQQYEKLFQYYESTFPSHQDPNFFSEHHLNLELAKAKLGIDDYNKKKAVQNYISAYRKVEQIGVYLTQRSEDNQDIRLEKLKDFNMKKLAIIGYIVTLLKQQIRMPSAKDFALALSKHTKNSYDACQIYEKIIAESDLEKKKETLEEYSDYLLEWGQIPQAEKVLRHKLKLQVSNYQLRDAIWKKLAVIDMDRERIMEKYRENLASWSRFPEEDFAINNYLQDLEKQLQQA